MRLIKQETGIALATALAVLAVLSVMSASVFAVTQRLSDTSTADRDAKRALAAADAGMEAAMFRANKLGLQSTSKCFTTEAVPPGSPPYTDPETGTTPAAGECPGVKEDLGNGATYTYYVTPELQENDVCAGLPVHYTDDTGKVTVTQRCVTSIGKAGNERRRVQERIASYIGTQLFPVGGILAINGLKVQNTAIVSGALGSNGQIQLGNNSSVSGGIELGTASTPPPVLGSGTTLGGPVTYRSESDGAFVLAPVDMGNTATENNNSRITSGQDAGSNVTYNPTTRSLTLANNGSLTLGGGTYNFCKVELGNNSYITIAVGARVRFFLDSPDRTGSGCIPSGMTAATARAAGYGGMVLGEGSNFNNPGNAINFQIYMYGYADGSQTVEFNNTSAMNAAIYAPNSNLVWKNTAGITGGVAASTVEFKNSAQFAWAGDSNGFSLSDLRTDTVSVYYRMAWTECRRKRTVATDPESGC
jgi:type II secretory pathway pseudopilin PulG